MPSISSATTITPPPCFGAPWASSLSDYLLTNPASVTTPPLTETAMSEASRSGSHFNSSRTSRSISSSDFMIGSSSVERGFAGSADDVTDRDQFMRGGGHSHDDHQLPLPVYHSWGRS